MPKRVEESTVELKHETSQDCKTAELQVPRPAQVPGTTDRPALCLSFRLAGMLHQRHLDFNSCVTGSIALNNCLSKRTDLLEEVSFLDTHLLRDLKLFIIDNSEDSCYFNNGNAEDCYFNDGNAEGFYFNVDQGADALKV